MNNRTAVRGPFFLFSVCLLLLGACAETGSRESVPVDSAQPVTRETSFASLPGWRNDRHGEALAAFHRSCSRWLKKRTHAPAIFDTGIRLRDWQAACRAAMAVDARDNDAARRYFEDWFVPRRIVAGNEPGLFTGYYEAELHGSWQRTARFTVPIYTRPKDLVAVDLGAFSPEWKGKKISGRVHGQKLVPYHDRGRIGQGAIAGKGLELLWVDSAVDAFFLHVQGSGRIAMTDGSVVRVGYAARNGRPYVAIGRVLIARGAIARENMSMQSIRAWLARHPKEAASVMAQNPSYIFFRRVRETDAIGAQGVPLTPARSLAIDRRFIPLGAPLWLTARDPLDPSRPLRRLMIAQDTGGAITGPVRGDVFWGFGREAAARAGRMKSPGTYFLLLPKNRCC